MKPGDKVTIYHDPLTMQRIEGEAKLIRVVNNDSGIYEGKRIQQWLIHFMGDPCGKYYERKILLQRG